MAYFPPDNIKREVFLNLADGDREKLNSAVELLVKYSMVNGQQYQSILDIHRVVQRSTRIRLREENKEEEALREALGLFRDNIKETNVNCAMSVWRYASKSKLLVKEFSKLPAEIISQLAKGIRYNEACLFGTEAFELLKDILGPDHHDTLMTQHSMALVLNKQGKYDAALNAYTEVLNTQKVILGPDHPDTLSTQHNMALVLDKQGNYSEALRTLREVLNIQKAKLGSDHPDTLLTSRNIEIISKKQASGCSIQFHQKQEEAYFHLSEFVSNNFQNVPIEPVSQGFYLLSFEERGVEFDGKCTAITRGFSQGLFSNQHKLLSNNTPAKLYECIAQSKQISEKEVFAFSKLFDDFEQQLDSSTSSLPPALTYAKGYKTLGDLSNYTSEIRGDFAIHLVTSNHVVAIYRTGNNYAYFDCNTAFVSGLKNVDQLIKVVEIAVELAGYKVGEKCFLVEHFNVDKANSLLSNENKRVLTKEVNTERQLTISNNNQQKNQLSEAISNKPESCLSGVTVDKQLQRSPGH